MNAAKKNEAELTLIDITSDDDEGLQSGWFARRSGSFPPPRLSGSLPPPRVSSVPPMGDDDVDRWLK